jgi:transketolase
MLNPDLHLNPKLFDHEVEQLPTRHGYGKGLLKAGEENPDVVAICADLTESTFTEEFAKKFPERYFEVGVAEQNMVTVAAGLGISGKIPFIASYATFCPGRAWEQIRTTICYNDSNVKIAGHHTGVSVGPDGATHQAVEDIAMMRVLPNMKVIVPCDAIEAGKATYMASHIWGPLYLRFGREKTPIMTTAATPFVPGKAMVFWESPSINSGRGKKPKVLIIATGSLTYNALWAARELEKQKIGSVVLNVHTIKPLDDKKILELAKKIGAVVTVEEHQAAAGFGGAIAELLARHAPSPIEFIGLQDTFGESGPPSSLIAKYGMAAKDIVAAAKRVIKRA